jgi:hypothetical protein
MGLPRSTRFGYDGALGALKTRGLYELREKRDGLTGPVRPVEG